MKKNIKVDHEIKFKFVLVNIWYQRNSELNYIVIFNTQTILHNNKEV